MTNGIATSLKIASNTIDTSISRYLLSLPRTLKFENFNENKVTGVTINDEKKRQITSNTHGSENQGARNELPAKIKGMELVKIPLAVVVSPLKFTVCSSSILNFASLSAEKSAVIKVI